MSKVKFKGDSFFDKLLSFKMIVLLTNFVFQGIRYMSIGEKIYKIAFTFIFFIPIYSLSSSVLISIFSGHLINYLVNGQFFVTSRYLFDKQVMQLDRLDEFLLLVAKLARLYNVNDVLIIGSFSRGRMSKTSDLDIRVFHSSGLLSSIRAYFCATQLRLMGLVLRFPVDIFCFSDISFLNKIDQRETPCHLYGSSQIIKMYPRSRQIFTQRNELNFDE